MTVDRGILRHELPQQHRDGMYLGRHLELDARSLPYAIEDTAAPIMPREWVAPIPTLDQGHVGSCTGNAGTRHLAALYGADDLELINLDGRVLSQDAEKDEDFALRLYHLATVKDGFRGTYPPDDTGSSGLGVCRALTAKGLISSYRWALSRRAFGTLLQQGGCIIGVPWYNAWFEPDNEGFVDRGKWQDSDLAGGHEIYVEALEAWDDHDASRCIIRFHNSWGDGWGDHGCGRMFLSTYETLKSSIDVKQFRR